MNRRLLKLKESSTAEVKVLHSGVYTRDTHTTTQEYTHVL
jgi:hypothetical protein